MARRQVEFVHVPELPLEALVFDGIAPGLRSALLSLDPQSGAETRLINAAPYWCWRDPIRLECDLELLVLQGDFRVGANSLRAGWYLFTPAGTVIPSMESVEGATLIMMPTGFLSWRCQESAPSRSRIAPPAPFDIRSLPWLPSPSYEGRPADEADPALSVKILWQDPDTSAYTLLTRQKAGWSDVRLESHATWEELLLLEGDYLMGATGHITGGSYIFRPPTHPHGPQATRSGAVWFCRGEKEIDFHYQDSEWARAQAERYLSQSADAIDSDQFRPWGRWSDD